MQKFEIWGSENHTLEAEFPSFNKHLSHSVP